MTADDELDVGDDGEGKEGGRGNVPEVVVVVESARGFARAERRVCDKL